MARRIFLSFFLLIFGVPGASAETVTQIIDIGTGWSTITVAVHRPQPFRVSDFISEAAGQQIFIDAAAMLDDGRWLLYAPGFPVNNRPVTVGTPLLLYASRGGTLILAGTNPFPCGGATATPTPSSAPTQTPSPLPTTSPTPAGTPTPTPNPLIRTLSDHDHWVVGVAYAPDGSFILSGSGETRQVFFNTEYRGVIKKWDASTGQELFQVSRPDSYFQSMVMSPDGTRVVGVNSFGFALVFATSNGASLLSFATRFNGINGMSSSLDGTLLAADYNNDVRLYDAPTGGHVGTLTGHTNPVFCTAFHPNGEIMASGGSDQVIKFWDVLSRTEIETISGQGGSILSLEYSPDGTQLVSTDSSIRLWDAASLRLLRTFDGHTGSVRDATFSPDGTVLASCGHDDTVRLWNVNSGDQIAQLSGHTDMVNDVDFSPDGTTVISGSRDMTVKVWDASLYYTPQVSQ